MTQSKNIRLATEKDSAAILEIYAPFIKDTAITFEYEVPEVSGFGKRISGIMQNYPWLVCEIDGKIVGYAYASRYSERAAYDWSADLSIYVSPEYQRRNIATALYYSLYQLLKLQGYYNAYVIITMPNEKSEGFHQSFGFKPVGVCHKVGYKFGKWHDVKWFELTITNHSKLPAKPKTLDDIRETEEFHSILSKGVKMIKG
jgi:Sortase and related acyltransferases